jgi:MoaA/NifB/PqqE/SkfB family radical SAM enzyme
MPALILTTRCPNTCPWCFARSKMRQYRSRGITEMGWGEFTAAVDFFERSGEWHINVLGGDPLLHPQIETILEYLEARRLSVSVGTTGAVPASLVDRIARRGFTDLEFGVNSSCYFDYSPRKRARVDYFLQTIGYPTGISYTLSERDLGTGNLFPVLDRIAMIRKFSLRRHLTLQVAAPAEGNRSFIPLHRYEELVDLLGRWLPVLEKNGIGCSVDCHSVPLCQMPKRRPDKEYPFRSRCESFPIDIGPDLTVWPCFPLAEHAVELGRFRDFDEVRAYFRERIRKIPLRYEEGCRGCGDKRNGTCDGGCFGFQGLRPQSLSSDPSCGNHLSLSHSGDSGTVGKA